MSAKHLYVANWKMNMHLKDADIFCDKLLEFAHANPKIAQQIIICPSFVFLHPIQTILKESKIAVGAQDCSAAPDGAYTGQVSAQMLAEVASAYCIVGHSECRIYLNQTPSEIAQKVERLLENNINPIICVGETLEQYERKITFNVVEEQLQPIIQMLVKYPKISGKLIYIAYEPIWAIGTGKTPDNTYLNHLFTWIKEYIANQVTLNNLKFLYGGSIDEKSAQKIGQISQIDGFLIGGASLDFQKFKKIVS